MIDKKILEPVFDILIEHSKLAIERKEVPVSCCFIRLTDTPPGFEIIAIFHNLTNVTKNATKHCEMLCLDEVYKKGLTPDQYIAVVTVEPCLMCGYALKLAKVPKTYYALPNEKFGGIESLYNLDLDCEKVSYRRDDVLDLLRGFYEQGNDRLEPNKRHRFKIQERTETQRELKRVKEN